MNSLKNYLTTFSFICCLLIASTFTGQAQDTATKKVESMKVAYINNRLELSPNEAEAFWPLYNQYQSERKAIRDSYRNQVAQANAEKRLDLDVQRKQDEVDLVKNYQETFKAALPANKVALFYEAEREFNLMILDAVKNK